MKTPPQDRPDGHGLRIAVLHSAFNAAVVRGLMDGCRTALRTMAVADSDVRWIEVPGAFELPVVASAAARCGGFDAIVALGAVSRGETDHYEHVARAAVSGLATVALATGTPVALGVLTVRKPEQARRRAASGPENKGAEAARAAVATARALQKICLSSLRPAAPRPQRVRPARRPRRDPRK